MSYDYFKLGVQIFCSGPDVGWSMYLLRKYAYRDIQHIIWEYTENKQQYGTKVTCRGKGKGGGGGVIAIRNELQLLVICFVVLTSSLTIK